MSTASKREKLKQLRLARQSGKLHFDTVEEEDNIIFDEVDESEYRQHKRDQFLNDDFIVDDDGLGYVDNGVDEWDSNTHNYYSDEEEDKHDKKKRKRKEKPVKKTAQINNFFQAAAKPEAKKVNAKFDDILDDFLDVVPKKQKTVNPFGAVQKKSIKKKTSGFNFSTTTRKETIKLPEQVSEPAQEPDSMDLDINNQPSSPIKVEKDITDDKENIDPESDSEDELITRRPRASASVKNKHSVAAVKHVPAPALSSSPPRSAPDTSYVEKLDESRIAEAGDAFKMFWLDYAEVNNTLLLFGKVMTKEGKLVSGVVQVTGINRELYILPRKTRLVDGDEADPVTAMDVHEEITPLLLDKFGLDTIKARPEKMKYAFELPGIPHEAEYLKVLLPYQTPKNSSLVLPAELEGETFSHIFGTNSNLFETFVLQRNIMGPCWLEVTGADFDSFRNATHCQVEVSVGSAQCVSTIKTNMPAPNLTVTSISVQTMMDAKSNKQEVVAVSLATFRDVPADTPVDLSKPPSEATTLVRPVHSVSLPPGLQQLAQKQGLSLRTVPNEKSLLGCFSAMIKRSDPDVFVGHRLENISLDVLVHRMYDLKVPTFSALGRRNRKTWPDRFGRGSGAGANSHFQIREIFQGRLLCDIANEMGQSLTSKCQSWDLPEMYNVVCNRPHSGLEINYNDSKFSDDASLMLMALKDNATNSLITAEIAFSVQILSLSKQLTNLAGNAWSHTLSGTRAGRNEYILLHEFKRNNYIVPDKEDKSHRNRQEESKKAKFQGGLVFEPEKGLHKNYILVMDFNSLYPSIIQEFNICFTTVDRVDFNLGSTETLPLVPERDSIPGVLPKLLNALVSRRREVKKLLKDPSIKPAEAAQFDIKQQALKLTANSMYGCLGYVNSRFYAKPLAMLVTNKGREILMDTRQLAESIGLRVVYGDTDSVMIDTGVCDFTEALKIGDDFKAQVNQRYRLLEIDTDNVFSRLLLHAKKKYAAMNASMDKSGKVSNTLEVKGLDMRRREYCQLSKDMSTFVLRKILSDIDPEVALSEVYAYLEEMTAKITNNEVSIDKYKINTRLSKDPSSYPNGKTMPPVQVAFRLREQGKVVKAGTVITFVITEGAEGSVAERARSFHEVLDKKANYKPDAHFYLEKQIFAPIERLVERIEGIDMVRIASSLGIDTKRYILRVKNSENGEIAPLEATVSDAERFRQSGFLVLQCKCGSKFRFGGIMASNDYKVSFHGICCTKCEHTFPAIKITAQLERAIRRHIATYYAGWLVCDDNACGITTRQISVYGKRCIGSSGTAHGCKGVMRYKYSDKALYNQLLYFNSIFDVDKAKKNELKPIYDGFLSDKQPQKLASGQVEALLEQNRELFGHCQTVVQKYLSDCGRRYVNMGAIFEFMSR